MNLTQAQRLDFTQLLFRYFIYSLFVTFRHNTGQQIFGFVFFILIFWCYFMFFGVLSLKITLFFVLCQPFLHKMRSLFFGNKTFFQGYKLICFRLVKMQPNMSVYFGQTLKDQQRNICSTQIKPYNTRGIVYTANNQIIKSGHLNGKSFCAFVCHFESRSRHSLPSWPHPIFLDTSSPLPECLDENVHHALHSHLSNLT